MKVTLKQEGNDALFHVETENGQVSKVHAPLVKGTEKQAPSPMETLLVAAAGCTSVDVLLILKKMKQPIENLEIELEGKRKELKNAKPFEQLNFIYKITGTVDQKKADRAVKLAIEKYCSVLESLHPEIKINYKIKIN